MEEKFMWVEETWEKTKLKYDEKYYHELFEANQREFLDKCCLDSGAELAMMKRGEIIVLLNKPTVKILYET